MLRLLLSIIAILSLLFASSDGGEPALAQTEI
jgi:hypothetical protein